VMALPGDLQSYKYTSGVFNGHCERKQRGSNAALAVQMFR
jgi:hypothetical protein